MTLANFSPFSADSADSIVSVALSLELLLVGITHCLFSGVRTFLPDILSGRSPAYPAIILRQGIPYYTFTARSSQEHISLIFDNF